MSLKDKAAKVVLADLDEAPQPAPPGARLETGGSELGAAAQPLGVARKARSGVAAISHSIGMHQRIQDLETRVEEYEQGGVVVQLDPKLIGPGRWKNRHPLSFTGPRFQALKDEIEGAGGNVQPIKVRRLEAPSSEGHEYEIVYGRRRHRACLELGLPVSAVVAQMSDLEVFQAMERENRGRADLSAWEQGVMYKDALDQGLFASQRQLCAAIGVDSANLSRSIRLASLPIEVIEAFESPLDLQFRWGADLADAVEKDTARVMLQAEELRMLKPKLDAKQVYLRLIGKGQNGEVERREFTSEGRKVASFERDAKGNATLKFKGGALGPAREKKLLEFLEKLLG